MAVLTKAFFANTDPIECQPNILPGQTWRLLSVFVQGSGTFEIAMAHTGSSITVFSKAVTTGGIVIPSADIPEPLTFGFVVPTLTYTPSTPGAVILVYEVGIG